MRALISGTAESRTISTGPDADTHRSRPGSRASTTTEAEMLCSRFFHRPAPRRRCEIEAVVREQEPDQPKVDAAAQIVGREHRVTPLLEESFVAHPSARSPTEASFRVKGDTQPRDLAEAADRSRAQASFRNPGSGESPLIPVSPRDARAARRRAGAGRSLARMHASTTAARGPSSRARGAGGRRSRRAERGRCAL